MSDAAKVLEEMAREFRVLAGKVRDQVPSARLAAASIALSARAENFDAVANRLTGRAAELRAADAPTTGGLPKPERVEDGQRWVELDVVVVKDDAYRPGVAMLHASGLHDCPIEATHAKLLTSPRWVYLGKDPA